jgi:hypothetical protein
MGVSVDDGKAMVHDLSPRRLERIEPLELFELLQRFKPFKSLEQFKPQKQVCDRC